MTSRLAPALNTLKGSSAEDVLAQAKRGVVTISASVATGTGWVALQNGIVVTSWRTVAFHSEVTLTTADGRRAQGRVVSVDAERDLGFVLPLEPLSIPPMPMRADPLPRLGERVTALIVPPNQPPNTTATLFALVAAVSAESDKSTLAALDPDLGPRAGRGGGPIIDASGQVIGVLALGRSVAQGGRGALVEARHLLPVATFSRDLRALDVPFVELVERAPIHRCPVCTEPFQAENDRCQTCGSLLPHVFETPRNAIGGERVVRDALTALGIVANKVRVGPRAWRVSHRALGGDALPSEVTVHIDALGLQVILRVPLVRIPSSNHEFFYRLLLTANDQSSSLCCLSLSGDIVVLSFAEPVSAFASEHDVAVVFHDLVRQADHYRRLFAELYGAEALHEGAP